MGTEENTAADQQNWASLERETLLILPKTEARQTICLGGGNLCWKFGFRGKIIL